MSDVLPFPVGEVVVWAILLGLVGGLLWWHRRERRSWAREAELRQQLWEVEDQIWRESLPDWQREAIDAADRERMAIKQEARRRLGLPEDRP
jgi:hypothetical protein